MGVRKVQIKFQQLGAFILGHTFRPETDVVVITGGSGGLGRALVSYLKEVGARTAILDVVDSDLTNEFVRFYHCDVSNISHLKSCQAKIEVDLGTPTVLINNAAIAGGKSILDMQFLEIERIIQVNLILNFFTTKIFLPGMMRVLRGYVVTISSVLAYMSPANFGAYGASKSGLLAFHESLTYELGPPLLRLHGIKTLLVCPGQMETKMFLSVKTPQKTFAKLDAVQVALKIMNALEHGKRGEMRLPLYAKFIPVFRASPWPIVEAMRVLSGIDFYAKMNTEGAATEDASSRVENQSDLD